LAELVSALIPISDPHTAHPGDSSEERFYASYEWSLDPVLSLRELFMRLREALEQFESHPPSSWQRQECKANLYLFVCAITCTLDDYLGQVPPNLLRISSRFPRLRLPLLLAQQILDAAHYVWTFPERFRVARWRRRWTSSVDAICEFLIDPVGHAPEQWQKCKKSIEGNLAPRLPNRLLDRRMQLPSGFRSQDLAHHDAISLARLFATSQAAHRGPVVIIGPRSMGAYFAPPVKAKLSELGWTSVSWCTLRPKKGVAPWEKAHLRALRSPDVRVLVVDESPNTGNTFLLMLKLLREFGVHPERIFLLAAMHPRHADSTGGARTLQEPHARFRFRPASVKGLFPRRGLAGR
jgi:adenine/guanine phosphoribosyltransferase-like PRPP-binding protein